MTTKEQSRIQVLNGMVEGQATVAQASGLMGVSEPHRWRLLAAYMKKGAAAILRARSGRRSNGHVTSNGTSTHSVHKANPPAATKTRTGPPRKPGAQPPMEETPTDIFTGHRQGMGSGECITDGENCHQE